MNKKKGISAIVATVLIILITVAAVTIIWAAIIPMVTDSLASGTNCLAADRALTLENKGYTCINSDGIVSVQVALGSDNVSLSGVQILISKDGSTKSETIETGLPGVNGAKVLNTTDNDFLDADTVSIAPIVTVGGTKKTCTVSNEVALVAC